MKIVLFNPPHTAIGSRVPGEQLPPLGHLAIVALLLSVVPAQADPTCLSAPTQDCVFQMALDQSLATPKAGAAATGLIVTAMFQETSGRDDWAATLDLLWPSVTARAADPRQARTDLGFALFGLGISQGFSGMPEPGRAPNTISALREMIDDIYDRKTDPEKEADFRLYQLGLGNDVSGIEAEIAAARWHDRKDFSLSAAKGLIAIGQIDAAFGLLRQVPDRDIATRIGQVSLAHVLQTEGLDAALALVRRFADRTDRAEALAKVALEMAQAGRLSDALAIADEPLLRGRQWKESWVLEILAEVYARGGEIDLALAYLRQFEAVNRGIARGDRIRIIAASVALDFDAARIGLAHLTERLWQEQAVSASVEALYFSSQPKVEAFLALLPPDHLPKALGALGRAQVTAGDVPGVLATLKQLEGLSDTEIVMRDLRADLARFLVRDGRVTEAVAMAEASGHSWSTAYVASRMK
ncbi:hypothetical protein OEZ60_12895 [Defluviimonas sp. WL0024]|uniref:Tetratricopeptide repeat-containing protein n=1 Tax=Albidovulum salinarum TaxID=2984153 RepID=A0ABT2X7D1_9RHOB|nr:hypothetical protein [Defluviimonas sp. WL0024]MCU9848902.1 hypothetical protein [Defluviimonas sp. WL0024]